MADDKWTRFSFISQKNIIISFSGCFNVLFQIIHCFACFARKMKLFLIGMKKISQTFRFMEFSTLIFCLFVSRIYIVWQFEKLMRLLGGVVVGNRCYDANFTRNAFSSSTWKKSSQIAAPLQPQHQDILVSSSIRTSQIINELSTEIHTKQPRKFITPSITRAFVLKWNCF